MWVQQQLLCWECSRPASGRAAVWGARVFSAWEKCSLCFSLLVGLSEAEHLSYLHHLLCSDLAATSVLVIFHPGALKQANQCPVLALVNQQECYQQPEEGQSEAAGLYCIQHLVNSFSSSNTFSTKPYSAPNSALICWCRLHQANTK